MTTDAGSPRRPILVADDEPEMLAGLTEILEDTGLYRVLPARDGNAALRLALDEDPDLLVLDIQMPGLTGIEVFRRLREEGRQVPAILVTGHADAQDAFEAFRYGVAAFMAKHRFDPSAFLSEVERLVHLRDLMRRDRSARAQRSDSLRQVVGSSPAMERIRDLVRRVAPTRAPVLLAGASGTGKELAARMIHNLSPRAAGPFVAVNCAAIPETLIESTLFGHTRGAFTGAERDRKGSFEEADGGTLFLDEIGDMSLATQAKILRALQEQWIEPVGSGRPRRVDVRVIAASNKDLEREIGEGRFREDLLYRINVVQIHLPPLSERLSDIPELVAHFARQTAEAGGAVRTFSPAALAALARRSWPGNLRELRNAVERLLILAPGPRVEAADVEDLLSATRPGAGPETAWPASIETLEEFTIWAEARFLLQRLRAIRAAWDSRVAAGELEGSFSIGKAAEMIGVSKSQVYKTIDRARERGWVPDQDLRDLLAS